MNNASATRALSLIIRSPLLLKSSLHFDKNNTNINIKKLDNPYNFKNKDYKVIIYDGVNKKFDIIYESYNLNLIGIILDSEFFILKRKLIWGEM